MRLRIRSCIPVPAAVALALALATPGTAGAAPGPGTGGPASFLPAVDIVVPQAWQGVWQTTRRTVDCATLAVLATQTYADTICAGEVYEVTPDTPCTGTITDDALNITCTFSEEVFPDCMVTYTQTFTGSRSGDTYTGTNVTIWDYSAGCPLADSCQRYEWEAVRLAEDPGCRPTPVGQASWSAVKQAYR